MPLSSHMVQSPLATASDGSPEQSIQADAIGVTVAEARKAEETASGNPLCTTGMLAFTAGALLLIVGGITTGALFAAGVIPFARGGSGETSRTVWDLTVAPSDARLRYAGRFAFSTDGSEAVSGWPGTRVALAVRGARRVSAVLANQRKGARYLATVDGVVADGSPFVIVTVWPYC